MAGPVKLLVDHLILLAEPITLIGVVGCWAVLLLLDLAIHILIEAIAIALTHIETEND
jgi:hypothetical protein